MVQLFLARVSVTSDSSLCFCYCANVILLCQYYNIIVLIAIDRLVTILGEGGSSHVRMTGVLVGKFSKNT